jgi:hypothetical protein
MEANAIYFHSDVPLPIALAVVILDIMRTIGWIVAGVAVVMILAGSAGAAIHALFPAVFDDQGIAHDLKVLVMTLCCTVVAYVAGGYVAKRGLMFGIVLLAVAAIGTFLHFDRAPKWYHIANLASVVPASILGARLRGSPR